ncbi:MAG: hypothetical protein N4A62_09910 [Marinisporobacter sp.]|jgi:hypothetical protein|nr:hypothetical protein [Marinisporobacter sp.]
MNGFMNKVFKGFRGKKSQNTAVSSKILNEMPENVLYGEDSGAIPLEDLENQLENDKKQ